MQYILEEFGVKFTWTADPNLEPEWKPFTYMWTQLPSGMSKKTTVYCLTERGFLKLIARWNVSSPKWKYSILY